MGYLCLRHHEEEEEVSAWSREGSASLVFCFVFFYPPRGLAKPGCLAPGGCERQADAVCGFHGSGPLGTHGHAQPGGWRRLTCSAPGSHGIEEA